MVCLRSGRGFFIVIIVSIKVVFSIRVLVFIFLGKGSIGFGRRLFFRKL